VNWIWNLRSSVGGMNGLEFAVALTAGGHYRALVHAAPSALKVEVRTDDGELIVSGEAERDGDYSPITLLEFEGGRVSRSEIWPTAEHHGLPVLLPGGEVGTLTAWYNDEDRTWWKWSIELSNHKGRPADWTPPRP
jgi:hypothetical protein